MYSIENNKEKVMVRLLTIAVIVLFSNFTVMADSFSGIRLEASHQHSQLKANAASNYSVNKQGPLHFQLTHDYVGGRWNVSEDLLQPHFSSATMGDSLPAEATGLRQYDAALLYPMVNRGMNLDLGLNIRFINGNAIFYTHDQKQQQRNFREAVPMFYAAALFELPFKGLSAGFVGRHSDSLINPSFDYKAKLSYEWAGGLGLEGGWQHQKYASDELNQLQSNPVSKGLFLDLRLRF